MSHLLTVTVSNATVQELYEVLIDGGQDVADVLKLVLARQPFQHVCQQLLHCLGDGDLLHFLSGILLMTFGCTSWQSLDAFAAHVAWAFHFQQCLSSLETCNQAQVLCLT